MPGPRTPHLGLGLVLVLVLVLDWMDKQPSICRRGSRWEQARLRESKVAETD